MAGGDGTLPPQPDFDAEKLARIQASFMATNEQMTPLLEEFKRLNATYNHDLDQFRGWPPEILKAARLWDARTNLNAITTVQKKMLFLWTLQVHKCEGHPGCLESANAQVHQWAVGTTRNLIYYTLPSAWPLSGIIISSIPILVFVGLVLLAVIWRVIGSSVVMLLLLVPLVTISALRLGGYALYYKSFAFYVGSAYLAAPTLMRVAYCLQLAVIFIFAWLWSNVAREMSRTNDSRIWGIGRVVSAALAIGSMIYMILGAAGVSVVALGWTEYDLFVGAITQLCLCALLLVVCLVSFFQTKATSSLSADKTVSRAFNRVLVAQALLVVSSLLFLAYTVAITFFLMRDLYPLSIVSEILFYASFATVVLSFYTEARHRPKKETLLQPGTEMESRDSQGLDMNNYDY